MTKKKKKVGRPKKKVCIKKPEPIVYPIKPLREFNRDEIRSWLCKLGLKRENAARITDTTFKNEFLVLVSCANGEDLYSVNKEKLESLTEEEFDKLIAKQNYSRQKRKPHHYLVSYLAQWDDGNFSIEEESVVIVGTCFKGKDGKTHAVDSRTVKIIEQID